MLFGQGKNGGPLRGATGRFEANRKAGEVLDEFADLFGGNAPAAARDEESIDHFEGPVGGYEDLFSALNPIQQGSP